MCSKDSWGVVKRGWKELDGDPYSAKKDKGGEKYGDVSPSSKFETENHKGTDSVEHALTIRFNEIAYKDGNPIASTRGKPTRTPYVKHSRYYANRLQFYAKTAHIEAMTREHPADDTRWRKYYSSPSRLLDFGVIITRLSDIDNPDYVYMGGGRLEKQLMSTQGDSIVEYKGTRSGAKSKEGKVVP